MSRPPRGGLGVRHAQARRQAQASGYRLTGVKAGSRVAETDKYRRWHLYYRLGTILRNSVTSVTVQWDDEAEWSHYTSEEARYRVDTNRWRITPPEQHSPLTALTSGSKGESIMPSPPIEGPTEEKDMADYASMLVSDLRKKALELYEADDVKGLRKAQLVELLEKADAENAEADEIDDEVEDELDDEIDDSDEELDDEEEDEVDEPPAKSKVNDAPKGHKPDTTRQTPPEPTGDTLTAKQVATRLGTDAKTLRKFFRSGASQFQAVGQGGRYEFAKDDLPAIKAAFEKYNSGKTTRTKRATDEPKKATGRMASAPVEELEEDEEEPTLEDLDDLELDDEVDDDELELDDEED